jgi:hypothetical protein
VDVDDRNPFPTWSLPATKGDVIRIGVYSRVCTSKLFGAMVALRQGDDAQAQAKLSEFYEADRVLSALIDEIGGKAS